MKGFKATNEKGMCRNLLIEVSKTYTTDGTLQICKNGLHFCANFLDVYNYYTKDSKTRVFEIEALGEIQTEGDKSVTNKLKVLRELDAKEILDLVIKNRNSGDGNSGNRNSGYGNSGNRNSGDWNSGDWNSGNRNSGYGNSGNRNSGDWNSGNRNSGNRNSGDGNSGNRNSGYGNSGNRNSGYGNSGNRNSGDWNSGDGNSGYFNTTIPVYLFNKPSNMKWTQEFENKIRSLNVYPVLTYVNSSEMTEKEKEENPSYKVTGGFLRKTGKQDWSRLTEMDKKFILSLPNYDDNVFKQITGISLLGPEMVKVVVNGVEKEIKMEDAKKLGLVE